MGDEQFNSAGISRRTFAGLGMAAGATAFGSVALPAVPTVADAPANIPAGVSSPDAFGALNPALTYAQIDPLAFFTYDLGEDRYFVDATGVQAANSGHYLAAPLPLPSGSAIYQINFAYRGASVVQVRLRNQEQVTPFLTPFQQTLPNIATAATVTYDLSSPVTIGARQTALLAFYSVGGSALYGVTVGYVPPKLALENTVAALGSQVTAQATQLSALSGQLSALSGQLSALSGQFGTLAASPQLTLLSPTRVYDSRFANQASGNTGGRIGGDTSRVVNIANAIDVTTGAVNKTDLVPLGAKAIVCNLTVSGAQGGGFLSITPGDAAALSASTINWSPSTVDLANGAIVTLDTQRSVKVFSGGGGSVDFIIDVAGYFT